MYAGFYIFYPETTFEVVSRLCACWDLSIPCIGRILSCIKQIGVWHSLKWLRDVVI